MAVVVGLDDITLASIAIKAISDNPAPARWVIALIGSLNFLYI